MNIAIIPARGGSKRIPRKNIKEFRGRPMIAYAISAATESGLFDYVVVSTDDAEIAAIANQYGAVTPFERPADLADDYTSTVSVVAHAVEACSNLKWHFDRVCCIYPCVPLIQIDDLKGALSLIKDSTADYCFPVTEFPSAIQRALKFDKSRKLKPFSPEFELIRTQDLESAYFDAGQFYWGGKNSWRKVSNIHSNAIGYSIPNWRVVDIDNYEDWHRAERLYSLVFDH
jgi:pseudaminic acid cytidylyltransferase